MEDFVSKIKETATKVIKEAERLTSVAVEKTGEVVDKTKISYTVGANESKIKKILAEVGNFVYDEYKNGAEFPEEIAEKLKTVEAFYKENEELKSKITDTKNVVVCQECGAKNGIESAYCSSCGAKIK